MKSKGQFYGIPYTIYNNDDGTRKPVIFFFHGFGGDRESGSMGRCESLAKIGYYVVAIDAYCHGERKTPSFSALSSANKQKEVFNIVIKTANDALFFYRNFLFKNNDIIPNHVSAYGVSLGGTTALYLATIMSELKVAVSVLGSPSFVDFYVYKQQKYGFEQDENYYDNLQHYRLIDPLFHHHKLSNKIIWMASGTKDETVPLDFSKKLKDLYPTCQNIVFNQYSTGHESTKEMIQDTMSFLSINFPKNLE